jgi:hypothetical protein
MSEEFEVRHAPGHVPVVAVPEWVIMSGVTPQAISLYVHLRACVEMERGFRPGTAAELLRLNHISEITGYLEELAGVGAVTLSTDVAKAPVRVNYDPPERA